MFKTRPGHRLASIRTGQTTSPLADDSLTAQTIHYTLHDKSSLFLLPDPVTCFRSASYNQVQTFDVAPDANVVILDWFTSGRRTLDEEWAFTRYYSENEVLVGGKRWIRDVTLLEAEKESSQTNPLLRRSLGERLSPYSCYAVVLLYGSQIQKIIEDFRQRFEAITIFKQRAPDDLIWSFSALETPSVEESTNKGAIVRVAGKETELVKEWLKEGLRGIETAVGVDVYRRAFA